MLEEDMVRGIKRGTRWEEIVNRWPFRKGFDHGRASGLHLRYIWPRGKPGGPTWVSRSIKLARARWPGSSPELANEDHWSEVAREGQVPLTLDQEELGYKQTWEPCLGRLGRLVLGAGLGANNSTVALQFIHGL
jgi:hypothetical protein